MSINSNIAFGFASVIMMGEWMFKKIQYIHDTIFFTFSKSAKSLKSNNLLSAPPRRLTHLTNCAWRSWVHLIRFLFDGAGLVDELWQTCFKHEKSQNSIKKVPKYWKPDMHITPPKKKEKKSTASRQEINYIKSLICMIRNQKLPPDKGCILTKQHVLVMWKRLAAIVAWNHIRHLWRRTVIIAAQVRFHEWLQWVLEVKVGARLLSWISGTVIIHRRLTRRQDVWIISGKLWGRRRIANLMLIFFLKFHVTFSCVKGWG